MKLVFVISISNDSIPPELLFNRFTVFDLGIGFAVKKKDIVRFAAESSKPSLEGIFVGLTGKPYQIVDLRFDPNRFTEQRHLFRTVPQTSPQRSFCLVANKDDTVFTVPQIML